VFNSAAKLQFGIATAALVAAAVYSFAADDPTGFAVLLGIVVATTLAGLVLTVAGIKDRAPRLVPVSASASTNSADGLPPLEMVSVDRSLSSRPSPYPLLAAVALGIFGVGLAVGHVVVIVGVVAGLLAAGGWLGQCWREDPSFTPREGAHISDRLLAPFGLPLLALTLVGVIVISVSRVLLAVPKDASVAIAFGLALILLVAFFVLASRPHAGRASLVFLSGFAVVAVVTAGSVSAASGYRTFEHPETGNPAPITVVAQGTQYKTQQIDVARGQTTTIVFRNLDRGTFHNVAVYSQAAGGTPYWNGEPIKGVKTITYSQKFTMAPGTYAFRCDFHPTAMIGKFVVKVSG
jgi:plastocyanin